MVKRPTTDGEREKHLEALKASGLSVREFAEQNGLSPWTVYDWRRKHRKHVVSAAPSLVEVKVVPDPDRADEELDDRPVAEVVVNDWVVRVPRRFDEAELGRLLSMVKERC